MGASANSAQMQSLLKGTAAAMVVADGPVAIRLKYTGSGTVTSATNDISTDLVLISSDGGTETFLYSTYTTVGALVDSINGSGYWECKALDSLRADATDGMFVDGAMTITSAGYYDLLQDTSASYSLTYRCTYDRNVGDDVPGGNHRVALQDFIYYATLGNADVDDVQIWVCNPKDNTETQVYQNLSVSATATTINFASGNGEITGGDGNDIVIKIKDDTSLDDSGAYMLVRYDRE